MRLCEWQTLCPIQSPLIKMKKARKKSFYNTGKLPLSFIGFLFCLAGCSVSKNYSPDKKFPPAQLQSDFSLLRNILEKKHPSLYWYTPKDSMDNYFEQGFNNITDSMTELQFAWKIIAPLTSKIRCGHTGFIMSAQWNKYVRNKRIPSFPLYLKVWADTMIVTANLNKQDSVIKRGTVITAINGISSAETLKKMYGYMSQDALSSNVNDVRLSLNFPYFHRNIFGLYRTYAIQYTDSTGHEKKTLIPYYNPAADTLKKNKDLSFVPRKKGGRRQRLQWIRSLTVDSLKNTAVIKLNSFSKGHLPAFFHRSFRKMKDENVQNLVIDIRNNGGGDINNFVSLTKYIRTGPFRVADTAASIAKNFRPYSKYIRADLFDKLALLFLIKKKEDDKYHFGYWEKRVFKPKRKYHFNGDVYVITNGLTFSASALFCNSVKGQTNVKLVGEETGGGWYGNSGIMIPDILLPHTKLRVRLPFFRLVQYNHVAKNGTGVLPDIFVNPTANDVRNGVDRKMETVKEMISLKEGGHN